MVTSFNGCCIVTQILAQPLTNVNTKREYKLKISSLFHFRQKSAKNQKNNESFLEKPLLKTFKNMEVMK